MNIDPNQLIIPTSIIIVMLIFRTPIAELIKNINQLIISVSPTGGSVTVDTKLEEITKGVSEIKHSLSQGKPYPDSEAAFRDLEMKIRQVLEEKIKNKDSNLTVDLKLVSVSMAFSWKLMIETKIPKILDDYDSCKINLQVVFVDAEYVKSLGSKLSTTDWEVEAKRRLVDIQKFKIICQEKYPDRLDFAARIYKNLPHWHGWLVNDEYLFLGRTDWQFPSNVPSLSVGQNKYRYFDNSSNDGEERIKLYKNWHRYYFEFASTEIGNSLPITYLTVES